MVYIGETGRSARERLNEHIRKNARQCHTAYRIVARWAYGFRRAREDVHEKRGAGRSDDVYVNSVRALLEEHSCWTCIELAREVGAVLHILKKKLKTRKICARWVPHRGGFSPQDKYIIHLKNFIQEYNVERPN